MEKEQESEKEGTDGSKKQTDGSESRGDTMALTGATSPASRRDGSKKKGAFSTLRGVFWRRDSDSPTSDDLHDTSEFNISSTPTRPGELNFQPYGFDLVLDFKWSRHPS